MKSILTFYVIFTSLFHTYGQNFEYPFVYPPKEPVQFEYAIDENGDTIEIVYDLPIISTKEAIPLADKVDTSQICYKNNFLNGNKLSTIKTLGCEGGEPYRLKLVERISNLSKERDLFKVKVPLIENCAIEFGGYIDISTDTLKLFYGNFSDSWAACDCCFTLEFNFESNQDKFNYFFLNEKQIFQTDEPYQTYPIKPWVVDGDTVGYFNKYNLKEGWYKIQKETLTHHYYFERSRLIEEYRTNERGFRVYETCDFFDDSGLHYQTFRYNKKGRLIEWEEQVGLIEYELRVYYPNNKLKLIENTIKNGKIKEQKHFKKNGKLKK